MQSQDPCLMEDQWIYNINSRIVEGKVTDYKLVRHFHVDNGVLYDKTPMGVLARCLSKEEARYRIQTIQEKICGMEGAPLMRRIL